MEKEANNEWYLLRAKPRQEIVAVENLERQLFRVFLPLMSRNRHRRGKWIRIVEPMFPGYLFISLDFARQNSASIRSTRGVVDFVRFGAEPRPVPESIIHSLKTMPSAVPDETAPLFRRGDPVAIVAGSLSGMQAIFQAEKGADRVILLLDLLGRCVRITMNRSHVVPSM